MTADTGAERTALQETSRPVDMLNRGTGTQAMLVALIVILAGGLAWRLYRHWHAHEQYADFASYYEVSRALSEGLDPYDKDNLPLIMIIGRDFVPPIPPFQATVFIPWTWPPFEIGSRVYFCLNIVCIAGIYVFVMSRYTSVRFDSGNRLLYLLGFLLFMNSRPVMGAVGLRQITGFVFLLLLLALASRRWLGSGILLALATLLKCSITPFYGVLLFCSGRIRSCLLTAAVVGLGCVAPAMFYRDLPGLYEKWFAVLSVGQREFDSFAARGASMLNADFFVSPALNLLFKFCILAALIPVILRMRLRREPLELTSLLFVSCATIELVYHRVYDLMLVIALLVAFAVQRSFRPRGWFEWLVAFILGYFLIPLKVDTVITHWLAETVGGASLLHLGETENFPLSACVMLLLTGLSWYYFRMGEPDRPSETECDGDRRKLSGVADLTGGLQIAK